MYHSEQINELALAMSKAQGEMTSAQKCSKNPFFKTQYADINSVLIACRPSLSKYGVWLTQLPTKTTDNGSLELVTMLIHSSGQWLKSSMPINVKSDNKVNDLQALGGIITYLRRYAALSMVGISTEEEDDDGNSGGNYTSTPPPPKVEALPKPEPLITSDQIHEMGDLLAQCDREFEKQIWDWLAKFKIKSIEDMTLNYFNKVKIRINTYLSDNARKIDIMEA